MKYIFLIPLFALMIFGIVPAFAQTNTDTDQISVDINGTLYDLYYIGTGTVTINSVEADLDFISLVFNLDVPTDGILVIELEREIFNATFNGTDKDFTLLADGEQPTSSEIRTTDTTRTLMIELLANTQELEIIGSQFITNTIDEQSKSVSISVGSFTPTCSITNQCYSPYEITVDVGDTVTWSNDDAAPHTIISGIISDGSDGNFSSGVFMPEDTFSVTFDEVGDYPYYCMLHIWMAGIIIVEDTKFTPNPPFIDKALASDSYIQVRYHHDFNILEEPRGTTPPTFIIELSEDGVNWQSYETTDDSYYNILGLTNYVEYLVKMKAVNQFGSSNSTVIHSAIPMSPWGFSESGIIDIVQINNNTQSIELRWNAASVTFGFDRVSSILEKSVNYGNFTVIDTFGSDQHDWYTDSDVIVGNIYSYRIQTTTTNEVHPRSGFNSILYE